MAPRATPRDARHSPTGDPAPRRVFRNRKDALIAMLIPPHTNTRAARSGPTRCSPMPARSASTCRSLPTSCRRARSTCCAMRSRASRRKSDGKLTFGFLFGFGIALWSANAGMKAIFDALNIIYDEEEKRGFIWLNLVSLFFTFCAHRRRRCSRSAPSWCFRWSWRLSGWSSFDAPLIALPALAGDVRADHRRRSRCSIATARAAGVAKWRWISVGSVFAALAWLVVSSLFSWYLGEFRQLQRHLWRARRRGRPDDVDVAFDHRGAGRRRAQFRDRAPDRLRLHRRARTSRSALRGAVMADTVGPRRSDVAVRQF